MELKICGRGVQVKLQVELRDESGNLLQGCADFLDNSIKLSASHCIDPMATFIHEYVHWWLVLSGHDMVPQTYSHESVCDVVGFSMSHLLSENPDVLKKFPRWYIQEVKRCGGRRRNG